MNIDDCLTEKTEKIFNSLKQNNFNIELGVNPKLLGKHLDCWGMTPTYSIIAPNETPNKAAFTHELLHIQQFIFGFVESKTIRYVVDTKNDWFSDDLLRTLNNDLSHLKMLPIFLNLGFEKEVFLSENLSSILNVSHERIKSLSRESNTYDFNQKYLCEFSIIYFLDKSMYIDSNESKAILKSLDSTLYEALIPSFNDWVDSLNSDNIEFFENLKKKLDEIEGTKYSHKKIKNV